MPFIYDETEIEWPDDGSEPPPPRPDQFVYLPAPEFGGVSEPARFSIDPPAASPEPAPPEKRSEAAPAAETPRRSFFGRLFGRRSPAAVPQQRQTSAQERMRQRQIEHERRMQRLFAVMVPALRASGARRAYCRYDGGNDEGFTWLDRYETEDGNPIDLNALSVQLFDMSVHDRLRDAGFKDHLNGSSRNEKIAGLRDFLSVWLPQEWACLMFGGGFGTGEYSMYGAFTVDLQACTVVDDPKADPVVENIRITA